MKVFNLSVSVLAGIGLVGLIVLLAIDKSTEVLLPVLTALVGMVAGINKDSIVGAVKMAFGRESDKKVE
jgi:hypothetical protein